MGLLIDGRWHDRWYESRDGRFEREQAKRRSWVTPEAGRVTMGVAVSRPSPGATISTYRWPVPGRTGR